jgi:hypothetical protein
MKYVNDLLLISSIDLFLLEKHTKGCVCGMSDDRENFVCYISYTAFVVFP